MKRRGAVVATIAMAGLVAVAVMAQDGPDRPTTQTQLGLPHGVADVVRAFVPETHEILTDPKQVRLTRGADDATGRNSYRFRIDVAADDGTAWSLWFEIDVERLYVSSYRATTHDPRLRSRDAVLSRDDAEAVAREFAGERFPRPFETMQLDSASDPAPSSAGVRPQFTFIWQGRVGDALRGDWLLIGVSASTGDIISFRCRPALDYGEEDVTVSEEQALASVRALIEDTAAIDMDEVEFSVTLMLSHPRTEGEGPAWQVRAVRPPLDNDRVLRHLFQEVDARTAEMIEPAADMEFMNRFFFKPEIGEEG